MKSGTQKKSSKTAQAVLLDWHLKTMYTVGT